MNNRKTKIVNISPFIAQQTKDNIIFNKSYYRLIGIDNIKQQIYFLVCGSDLQYAILGLPEYSIFNILTDCTNYNI